MKQFYTNPSAFGPFKTEQEAIDDCRVQFGEE
jgi:hypothetical protein